MKCIFSVIFGARKFSHPTWKFLNTPLPCIYLVYTFLDQYSNHRSSSNSSAWAMEILLSMSVGLPNLKQVSR